jgi:hypothetical protein
MLISILILCSTATSAPLQANYPHIVKEKCDLFTNLSISFGEAINTGQELGH